jgi:hypothetical protein
MKAGLDLHCPHLRGKNNEHVYLVGSRFPRVWREQMRFGRILEKARRGPLPYRASDNLPFGVGWNTGPEYAGHLSASEFMSCIPGVAFGSTVEVPYATARGKEVNQRSARIFGHDIVLACRKYLEKR